MNKRYLATIVILFFLRALDLFLTYLYIPNLNSEYNPIVSIFGASWFGLISIQFIFLVVISFLVYFYFKLPSINVTEKKLNFSDFVYCYFFDKSKPWPRRMMSNPKNLKAHIIFISFMIMSASILVSLFAILNNLILLMDVAWYRQFLLENYKLFFPGIFCLIAIGSFFLFFTKEYTNYTIQTGK